MAGSTRSEFWLALLALVAAIAGVVAVRVLAPHRVPFIAIGVQASVWGLYVWARVRRKRRNDAVVRGSGAVRPVLVVRRG